MLRPELGLAHCRAPRFILSPIPKPNKDPKLSESYRPITLASCLFKILEKIVNDRLYCTLDSKNFFNKFQCGFRKLHSTTDALVLLESHVRDAFNNQEHCVAVSLDISRAYETTWITRVLQILIDQNLRGNLMHFIQNLHQERSFRVRVGSTLSVPKGQDNGISQGLSISCTLFLIAINDIVSNVHPKVNACLFADDCTLFMKSKFISELEVCMQHSLDNLTSWTNTSGFLFSPQKCQAIHFCRKRKTHNHPKLSISNHDLTFVNSIKLLGLHLDVKWNFKVHLNQLKTDCLKRINLMKILSNIRWGADYKTLLLLYRGYIRSKLDYGSIVYSSASPSSLKILDTVHHQGVRLALGAFRSSPITSLLSEAGEPPLSIRRKILLGNYLLRTRRDPRHIHHSLHDSNLHYRALLQDLNINLSLPNILPCPQFSTPWTIQVPSINYEMRKFDKSQDCHEMIKSGFLEIVSRFPQFSKIYTDASKNDSSVAAAFWSPDFSFKVKLNPLLSICNAELMAILYTVYFILANCLSEVRNSSFLLCTDSLSALQSLQDIFSPNPVSSEIRKLLHENKHTLNLCFMWIPSHVGIHGNDKADLLAKETLYSTSPAIDKIPIQDFKHILKRKIMSSWHEDWEYLIGNKLRLIKEENKPWHPPQTFSRRDQVTLTRLRIGHTNLTHVHLMRKEQPPECNVCQCNLTVKHILKDCCKYQNIRNPNNLHACLNNDPTSVLNFIKMTKLKM
ncbi:hypothetical protein M8J77_021610 [Diaphorina citri]|nr:hypothetical protein M8J77_021610 [Diaphorina citri]